jgi:hypothetical protein
VDQHPTSVAGSDPEISKLIPVSASLWGFTPARS